MNKNLRILRHLEFFLSCMHTNFEKRRQNGLVQQALLKLRKITYKPTNIGVKSTLKLINISGSLSKYHNCVYFGSY